MINFNERSGGCPEGCDINVQEVKKNNLVRIESWKPDKEALKQTSDKTSLWAKAYVSLEHSRNN